MGLHNPRQDRISAPSPPPHKFQLAVDFSIFPPSCGDATDITRVAWTSDHSVMYHQVSVASQSEGIARRFYFTGLADYKLDHLVWDRTDRLVSIVGSPMDMFLIV